MMNKMLYEIHPAVAKRPPLTDAATWSYWLTTGEKISDTDYCLNDIIVILLCE
jgi:hypothetical protein